ncbi:MAG TPA: hypothetical protein VN924_13350 [Bryobacteraceae bacterium]|nr:hypothetical protein [Bryobacteraceae bacterium]
MRTYSRFAAQYFGARPPSDFVHKKQHQSELIVRSDHDLATTSGKVAKLAARLTEISSAAPPFQWFGFELRTDAQGGTPLTPIFKFEREVGVPAQLNRYYSSAGISTEDHRQLLNDFEQILAG